MHIAYPPPLYMDLTYYNPLLACRSPQYVIILVCVCDGCRISWRSLSTQLGTGEKKKKKRIHARQVSVTSWNRMQT